MLPRDHYRRTFSGMLNLPKHRKYYATDSGGQMVYGNAMIHAVCNGAAKQGDDGCEPNQGKKLNHKSFWFDKTVKSFRIFRPSVFWHFAKK